MRFILRISGVLIALASGCAAHDFGAHTAQAGEFRVELFVEGRDLTLYIWDPGERPIDGVAVTATALVRAPRGEAAVDFIPIGERLHGHAPFAIGEGATVSVTFSVRGGPDNQADFSPVGGRDHKHHTH